MIFETGVPLDVFAVWRRLLCAKLHLFLKGVSPVSVCLFLFERVLLSKRKPVYPRPGKGRLYARVTGDLRGGDDCHCASNEKQVNIA